MKYLIKIKPSDLLSKAVPVSKPGKFIQFPLVRIIVGIVFIMPVIAVSNAVSFLTDSMGEPLHSIISIIRTIITFALLILAYHLYTKIVEKRKAYELSTDHLLVEWLTGFLISLFIIGSMILLMFFAGYYRIEAVGHPFLLVKNFFYFGIGAFIQCLVFRLILFKDIEEITGTWIALVVVGAIFGFAHLFNENATLITSIFLMISEVLLVGSFILTRRIWMVWGIHLGWNFLQTGLFGMANSGLTFQGYITPVIDGPKWFTGGEFGIEASIYSLVMNVCVGIAILYFAVKNKQMLQGSFHFSV